MTEMEDVFLEETENLARVIHAIRTRTDSMRSRMPVYADYARTADAIQRVLQRSADTIESAAEQPYFGRIDFLRQEPSEEHPRTVYIGAVQIPDTNVISWVAPAARLWYTNDSKYSAPLGEILVRVDLKRYLRIRGQQLVELNDIYRRALPEGTTGPNPALTAALSGTGDGHLSVIIETIEPDQYESIANVSDQVLVVQGAAGSGKSEIGFHRIAYLLSPFNELPENQQPTADTTLFIGPSRSFLEYAADVLPSLGVRQNVRQMTLAEWIAEHRSAPVTPNAKIWNNLLDSGRLTKFNAEGEAFKGSMAMVDTLDRHVRNLADGVRKAMRILPPLVVNLPGRTPFTVRPTEVQTLCGDALTGAGENLRLNPRRRGLADSITNRIASAGRTTIGGDGEEPRLRRYVESEIVSPWLDSWWPRIDYRQEYSGLLSDPENLVELSRGALSLETAQSLAGSLGNPPTENFEDSDRGALAYLDHLLNDRIPRRNRHIVVDEAQDISPIEFWLLRLSSTNNWFTVLGDTAQQLTPYRGIRRWRDIERALGRSTMKVQHARTSYRSNQHITRFNNRILRLFDSYIDAPVPFGREGHRVEYHRHARSEDMYRDVVQQLDRIRALDGLDHAKIAILTRDRNNLNRFQRFCKDNAVSDVTPFGQDSPDSATVLARVPDAKGLEYDAVIVLGVNESFASTTFNQKLLYLAATRAKHYLAIHWSGKHSPILQAISGRGVRKFNNR